MALIVKGSVHSFDYRGHGYEPRGGPAWSEPKVENECQMQMTDVHLRKSPHADNKPTH